MRKRSNRSRLSWVLLSAFMVALLPQKGIAGTCDIYATGNTPCGAAYSTVRALYDTYSGSLYQVRRADNTTKDIGVLATGGVANAATQDAFCAGSTCTISIIYDQSGKGNHLSKAPGGSNVYGPNPDIEASATALPIYIAGHKAYGLRVTPNSSWTGTTQVGYRTTEGRNTGLATGDQPESIYEVTDGAYFDASCCFDFGNTEKKMAAGGPGAMEALYFGNVNWWDAGAGNGPWIMADLEVGVFNRDGVAKDTNVKDISFTYSFVTAMLKGNSNGAKDGGPFTLKGGNAQTGSLITVWDGARPNGYATMHKEGGVILGVGGDNSGTSKGDFYEGVLTIGYATTATDNAVQANIVAAGYGVSSLASSSSTKPSSSSVSSSSKVVSSSSIAASSSNGSSSSKAASSSATTGIISTENNPLGLVLSISGNSIALHLDHALQGSIEVRDLFGIKRQQVRDGSFAVGDHSFHMNVLPTGIYIVRFVSGQGIFAHKFAVVSTTP